MTALLDRLHERHPTEVNRAFEHARTASLGAWLEQLSADLALLAFSDKTHLGPRPTTLPPERCAPLMAASLSRHFPERSETQLRGMSNLLVWAADGVLEGARRRIDVPQSDAAQGLLATWRGIVLGWSSKI